MVKPSLASLWKSFPTHDQYPSLKDLYEHLGGTAEKNIYSPGFGPDGNGCASRMSVALNASSAPINGALVGPNRTVGTRDKQRIIFGVADLRAYLEKVFGKPLVDTTRPYDDAFKGKKGIIAFSVNWDDATGHIALYDGTNYREPAHDDYASFFRAATATHVAVSTYRGEFWELRP